MNKFAQVHNLNFLKSLSCYAQSPGIDSMLKDNWKCCRTDSTFCMGFVRDHKDKDLDSVDFDIYGGI